MANTNLIAPLVVAGIGLAGTVIGLIWGFYTQRYAEKSKEKVDQETRKWDIEQKAADQRTKDHIQNVRDANEERLKKEMANLAQQHAKDLAELQADLKDVELRIEERQTHKNLTTKYSAPLLVAAYDLQQRLFELVEYPISRQHLTYQDGLDDIKKFSCYLLAQYLAYSHILRTKTGYLSFSDERD